MWSVGVNGNFSLFGDTQRVLFPVREQSETTKRFLIHALEEGTCAGVSLLAADDVGTLHMVRNALHHVCAKIPHFHPKRFRVALHTSPQWADAEFHESVSAVLSHLQIDQLDLLLLARGTMPTAATTTERKAVVLRYWEQMATAQRLGLVRQLGFADATIQDMEFVFTACPDALPNAIDVCIDVASDAKPAHATEKLSTLLSFAHGNQMDVLVRLPYRTFEENPDRSLRERWAHVVQGIAQRVRDKTFELAVVHEAETDAYRMETRATKNTRALQSSTQVLVRYLVQKGVVVVPLPISSDSNQFDERDVETLFVDLTHPFTALAPTHSPHVHYSSILTKEELATIDHVLPLVVDFASFNL
ncbi:hypothetical protein PINS_up004010 [Pythium insidiosum]|nr:hypothetical protein PINS_up004010 [Pythium insidiosum]